jgi:hypothetical protein
VLSSQSKKTSKQTTLDTCRGQTITADPRRSLCTPITRPSLPQHQLTAPTIRILTEALFVSSKSFGSGYPPSLQRGARVQSPDLVRPFKVDVQPAATGRKHGPRSLRRNARCDFLPPSLGFVRHEAVRRTNQKDIVLSPLVRAPHSAHRSCCTLLPTPVFDCALPPCSGFRPKKQFTPHALTTTIEEARIRLQRGQAPARY